MFTTILIAVLVGLPGSFISSELISKRRLILLTVASLVFASILTIAILPNYSYPFVLLSFSLIFLLYIFMLFKK
jgi:hypothetical protein